MHLQSSLYTAIVFIALGFALHVSESELAGNLVEKSLTYVKREQTNSPDAFHKLVGRDAEVDGLCTAIYNCPTTGSGTLLFFFGGKLQETQNHGGVLKLNAPSDQGLVIKVPPDKSFATFPDAFGVDWSAKVTAPTGPPGEVCLIVWTFSVKADMPNPNSLQFSDLLTHLVMQTCFTPGRECGPVQWDSEKCTLRPGSGCNFQ
jgi:hypothetical protein